ncbi:MAG: glycerol-3-phosphate dehydrogenase [Bacteroidetes bacterium]|nr:MAG: glycerol-3-phosphate dehydrogenase [Bacteroidota bacterium]
MKNIVFIGSGAIATAIGNVLAAKNEHQVILLSIEEDVVDSINTKRINSGYFPNIKLVSNLKASLDKNILNDAEIIFLAIPSSVIINYVKENNSYINPKAILVNLAKGFGDNHQTIVQCLEDICDNPIATLKGPTFARDIITRLYTGITVGCRDKTHFNTLKEVFKDTSIVLDYSSDIIGVELLSILKNIYAIAVGIIDASYNSPNLRFMVLTNAFKEMRHLLIQFDGEEQTIFNYCGFGDFGLTALNDLSRNRTLGLLIGKGFFTQDISDKVLLEGKIAVNVFCEQISNRNSLKDYHIISELYKVFNEEYDVSKFLKNIL